LGDEKVEPLPYVLPPTSIRIKAITADHDLSLIGDMGGDSGDESQIIHRLFLGAMP
jgi:hypothetical protein